MTYSFENFENISLGEYLEQQHPTIYYMQLGDKYAKPGEKNIPNSAPNVSKKTITSPETLKLKLFANTDVQKEMVRRTLDGLAKQTGLEFVETKDTVNSNLHFLSFFL